MIALKTPKTLPLNQIIKPLFAKRNEASLNVNITKYFTDVNGTVIDKTTAPASLRKSFPVFMFGNFDRTGGYNLGLKTVPAPAGVFFLMTYVHGVNEPFLWNTGFNTIQNFLRKGDLVCVYTDDLDAPNGFVFIVQTCDYGAMASIISNTQTEMQDGKIGEMNVKNISYQVDNEAQITQVWQIVTFDNLGQFEQHPFNPIIYKPPYYKLTDFIQLELSFLITQFIGLNFLINDASDTININFRLIKQ